MSDSTLINSFMMLPLHFKHLKISRYLTYTSGFNLRRLNPLRFNLRKKKLGQNRLRSKNDRFKAS